MEADFYDMFNNKLKKTQYCMKEVKNKEQTKISSSLSSSLTSLSLSTSIIKTQYELATKQSESLIETKNEKQINMYIQEYKNHEDKRAQSVAKIIKIEKLKKTTSKLKKVMKV